MKHFVFLLVVLWACCAFGATKYVATDGNDADTGDIGDPWKTLQHAVDTCNDGDTVKVYAGNYNEPANNRLELNRAITLTFESESGNNDVNVIPSHTTSILYVQAAGTYTFSNMTFRPSGASCTYLFSGGNTSDYSATFNDCIFDMNGLLGTSLYTGTGTGEVLTYNNCDIIVDNSSAYGSARLRTIGTVEYNDCNFIQIGGLADFVLFWTGDSNTLTVKNSNFNAPSATIVGIAIGATYDSLDHLIITGNTVTDCGKLIYIGDEDVRFANISNNTITSTGVGMVFSVGKHSGTGTNTLSGFVIKNNILTKNATDGDCMLLGTNCYGAEVSHNIFTSTDPNGYGIVVKGKYNNIHHNICKSTDPLYLYDNAQYNKVQYNTTYATAQSAFAWGWPGEENTQINNVITNNIFDASGGGTWAMKDLLKNHFDNYIDYNCYKAGRYGTVKLDGTKYNTISTLQAKWATWSDVWPENDAHSIIADPQFLDPASGDFRLKPGSPCLNAGEPTPGNGHTDMGAWQAIGRSELLLPNCTRSLEMDFNGDCKIDFQDFALFSLGWLECNLDPPEACWE